MCLIVVCQVKESLEDKALNNSFSKEHVMINDETFQQPHEIKVTPTSSLK